jgi:hypothetical protein
MANRAIVGWRSHRLLSSISRAIVTKIEKDTKTHRARRRLE